jgi:ArsR family transcriptional regulator
MLPAKTGRYWHSSRLVASLALGRQNQSTSGTVKDALTHVHVLLLSDMDTKSLVKIAKALSDPNRLRLLQEISQASQVACAELFEVAPLSQPSMSHHVKALVDAGLVESRKEGRCIHLSVNPEKLQELESFLQILLAK